MSKNHADMSGENNPMFGKHHTEETRKKMSEAKTGKNHPMFGKHHTDEARKKMSEAKTGEKNPMFGRTGVNNPMSIKVIAFTDSGSYYKEFAGIREAERELGVGRSNICKCVKGKTKSAGKYNGEPIRWKYKEL